MKEKIIKVLKVILPISIGVYLTWYFISNSTESEKEHFISAFTGANYLWILLALVIAFLSHFSRAYRWKYLLQTLDLKPKVSLMYHSVMIGYIINLTIPRSGEIARAGYFSKYQKVSADKIFGTIVVERVVDLIMFGIVILTAIYLQADQQQFNAITQTEETVTPAWLFPLIVTIAVIGIVVVLALKQLRLKVVKFIKGIVEGCLTIVKLKQKGAYLFHTFFIWIAYIAMFWVTALALPDMNTISVNAVFACFVAGSIAIGATPGGIGLYPIMVAAVLTQLYGYEGEVAKSFSMLMWSSQTIFIVLLGLISLFAITKQDVSVTDN